MVRDFRLLHYNDYKDCSFASQGISGDKCLLNIRRTRLNFMPFRLKLSGLCMEAPLSNIGYYQNDKWIIEPESNTNFLSVSTCRSYQPINDMMVSFYYAQMFHFYPKIRSPQTIRLVGSSRSFHDVQCLTVKIPSHTIYLRKCTDSINSSTTSYIDQLFLVSIRRNPLKNSSKNARGIYVQFKWQGSSNISLCIQANHDIHFKKTVSLMPCNIGINKISSSLFLLEHVNSSNYLK